MDEGAYFYKNDPSRAIPARCGILELRAAAGGGFFTCASVVFFPLLNPADDDIFFSFR
jgi:hypothetical protein